MTFSTGQAKGIPRPWGRSWKHTGSDCAEWYGYASTHGSPWAYDTNVPLAMHGPSWINSGKYGDSEVVDLARTIAFILNVRPPNGCEGRVLSEVLR